ncbi:mCG142628 [Mus musculus]|nr:mCG142628 [Mus musculus]
MEKSEGRKSVSQARVENGMENPGLELMEGGNLAQRNTLEEVTQGLSLEDGLGHSSLWSRRIFQPFTKARSFFERHAGLFRKILLGLLCLAYTAYFLAACILNFQRALALFVITCLVFFISAYHFLEKLPAKKLIRCLSCFRNFCLRRCLKWVLPGASVVSQILWLVLDTAQRPEQLISFAGICMFILILFACSKHHSAVCWRTVFWGLGLQFIFGILVIRTEPGFNAFQWLGDQIQIFLAYTVEGSSFVFGDTLVYNVFAFQSLPIIIFFGCVMSILYYLGLVQWMIQKIALFLQSKMGTTAPETLAMAGNIFVGLLTIADMTISEIHAFMTGDFATIAGTVLGAFIFFGIDASSLISASVMAAPCALALSKLVYPEVKESKFKSKEGLKLPRGSIGITLGGLKVPLLIRPYLADMTISEIHAVMTGGFATIAGTMLGAFISFGIDASSLISASVMAAPCALALSKLVYPEVKESKFKSKEGLKLPRGEERNILEAASNGATEAISLVANVAANLIAFLAVLAFVNATLSWLGEMVDFRGLSFQVICSYILRPMAFMMAVQWTDCLLVIEIVGVKFFINEFVAYQQLIQYKNKRLSGVEEWINGEKQWISVKAEIITTFSLCGFANLSSIGITLGGLTSMITQRKSDLCKIVVRALFTGACVSFISACMAASMITQRKSDLCKIVVRALFTVACVSFISACMADLCKIVVRALFTVACVSFISACMAGILYVPRGAETDCVSFLNTNFTNRTYETYVCCRELFQSTSLNGTNMPSFSGPWQDNVSSLRNLASCCDLYTSTVCA